MGSQFIDGNDRYVAEAKRDHIHTSTIVRIKFEVGAGHRLPPLRVARPLIFSRFRLASFSQP
jgi:hypothetical protein